MQVGSGGGSGVLGGGGEFAVVHAGSSVESRGWAGVLLASMAGLWEKHAHCDVSIVGGDGGTARPAHSIVLSAASPVLAVILQQKTEIIHIPVISTWLWDFLLKFIYTGQVMITMEEKQKLPEMELVAKQLEMNHLAWMLMEIQKASYGKAVLLESSTHGIDPNSLPVNVDLLQQQYPQQQPQQLQQQCIMEGDLQQQHLLQVHGQTLVDSVHMQQQSQVHGQLQYDYELQQQHQQQQGHLIQQHMQFQLPEEHKSQQESQQQEQHHGQNQSEQQHQGAQHHLEQHHEQQHQEQQQQQQQQEQQQQHQEHQQQQPLQQHEEQEHPECHDYEQDSLCSQSNVVYECERDGKEEQQEQASHHTDNAQEKADPDYVPDDIQDSDPDEEEITENCASKQITKTPTKSNVKTLKTTEKELKGKAAVSEVTCTACKKKVSSGYLKKHYLKCHKELCEVYKCTFCASWESYEKFEYLRHMRTHTGGKAHVCGDCHASFTRRELLRDHVMREHEGSKHECRTCAKQFSSVSALRAHRYTAHDNKPRGRTKRRPKVCGYCGHVFYLAGDLRAHEMAHRGEKPFPCSHCPMAFTTASHRRKHEAVHANLKPHMCSFCGFATNRKANLRSHERLHTGDRPYPCDLCNERFRVKTQLKKHKLKIHSIDISQEESKNFVGTDLRRRVKRDGGGGKTTRRQTVREQIATKHQAHLDSVNMVVSSSSVSSAGKQETVLSLPLQAMPAPPNVHTQTVIASKVLALADSASPGVSGVGITEVGELGGEVSGNMAGLAENTYCVQPAEEMPTLQHTTNLEPSTENWINLFG